MLPDVVDDFAERHPSFRDLEPLFFSGYAFSSKLAGGLSAGFSTMVLQSVGLHSPSSHLHPVGVFMVNRHSLGLLPPPAGLWATELVPVAMATEL